MIRLENVRKAYGSKRVLHGIDLEVPAGQVLGYIGPNGAGKSTTVKILVGTLGDYDGLASVAGLDLRDDPVGVKRRIGYVPENVALYDPLTPQEFFRFLGRIHEIEADRAEARGAALLEALGLAGELDASMGTFSKGMRQKVAIAAAVMHAPDVLFLDEPLSGLDANSVVTVKEIVERLARRGKTVFYCSHVMDVVERVCDRIVLIHDGRIAADGSFESLKSRTHDESLERVFTRLTGASGHEAAAEAFVEIACDPGAVDA